MIVCKKWRKKSNKMSNDSTKVLIGKIVAPQGINGDVRVQTYTATPDDFRNLIVYSDKFLSKDFKFIRRLNPTSDIIVGHIVGIDNRNMAENIRGTELFTERSSLPQLQNGEYYQCDLIGFDVVRDGDMIGRVDCFQNFGAGDILELDTGEMVPFIGADVDVSSRVIRVK